MKAINYVAFAKLLFITCFFVSLLIAECCLGQTEQRLRFSSITPSINTGQDYSPWLSDSVDTLVQAQWLNNFLYIDVTLKLATPGKITKLMLYDYEGVFTSEPAYIYALKGTTKTLIKEFTGPSYMSWETTTLAVPLDADAIVIHKFSNSIPQKIFVYGYPDEGAAPPVTVAAPAPATHPVNTDSIVKIPIIPSRWYQLNNVSNGLEALTDGVIDVNFNTGWGHILKNFDAYYPVADGERITLSKVRFFSFQGGTDDPMTLSVINSQGRRIDVGKFRGFHYYTWVGPYPDRDDSIFDLDSIITDIKYLVVNSSGSYPTEMELYGTYTPPAAIPPMVQKPVKLKQFFGVNAFEWNFENGAVDPTLIDPTAVKALKSFTQIRHYMDWEKLESDQGSFTFNPTRSGGWNYDAIYQFCKTNGMEVLADLKQMPGWMVNTYPDGSKDTEGVPLRYGSSYADPASYIDQAKVAFQFAARYGANANVDSTLLSVNGTPRWTADPVNVVKRGMNLIRYIECDNERDKWWRGRGAYQTSYEYAANMSAFYDGNKNTMGPGVGVKNADPTMLVVMGGLATADPGYVRGMIDWCKQHRGFKADGSVNLCWDVINYHLYSNDSGMSQNGQPTRGTAPDVGNTGQIARDFVQMSHELAKDMPVWVTELGYDLNQGSPLKAIPIGNKTAAQVQADWILRSSLLYARNGADRIFFYEMYDDNALNPIQFGSSGLINDDKTRRASADYLYQTNKLLGEYSYKETLNADPIVDHYDLNGKAAYVLVVPDEKGRTADYQLDLPGVDSAKVYTPTIGADSMTMRYVRTVDGKLKVTVTETPLFVIPIPGSGMMGQNIAVLRATATVATQPQITPLSVNAPAETNDLKLYPNPSVGYFNVGFNSDDVKNAVSVRVMSEQTGKVIKTFTDTKSEKNYSRYVDMSSTTMGVYMVEVKQGNTILRKKLIRVN